MADLSNQTAFAVVKEVTPGTFVAPNTTTDTIQMSNVRVTIGGLTQDLNEYTGTLHRPGPQVLGSTFEVSGTMFLRGIGGTTVPSADAWTPGRILQAAGFAENRIAAAIPTLVEALAAGTTTAATLGTTAVGTADLYKGLMLLLAGLGSGMKRYTMIRSYTAGKVATLAEVAASALNTSNYQIPKQLAYQLSAATPPSLSVSVWHGGKRFDGNGMAISSFRINLPTASRESQELPSIEFTLTGNLQAEADQACPTITPGLAVPPFRDGKLWVASTRLPGSSFSIDLNAQTAFEPDPNQVSGNGPAQLTGTQRTVSLTLSQVALATFDPNALANAGGVHPVQAVWGSAAGNAFGIIVTDARFNYRSPDASGQFVNTTGEMFVDGSAKDISLSILFQ
jgi:hypothetical protein